MSESWAIDEGAGVVDLPGFGQPIAALSIGWTAYMLFEGGVALFFDTVPEPTVVALTHPEQSSSLPPLPIPKP